MKRSKKIGASLFAGGILFFYIWLAVKAATPLLPSPEQPLVFYATQTNQDLKFTLCKALDKAQKSIDIQMYGITDDRIIETLQKKQKQGLAISVLYDKSASGNLSKKIPGSIAAKTKGLMHRKIIALDGEKVFLGTANLTPSSLQHHDNLLLGFYQPQLAAYLKSPASESLKFTIQDQNAEIWMLPSMDGLNRLLEMLQGARKTIRIAMFTFTHPKICEALIDAKSRGVEVKIAMDYYTARGASQKTMARLQEQHVPLVFSQGQQLLHHKWAVIDNKILIAGSANWTKSAFERNQDYFLILHSLNKEQKRFLKKLWKTIEEESAQMLN